MRIFNNAGRLPGVVLIHTHTHKLRGSEMNDFAGYGEDSLMKVNGLSCTLHMPKALKSKKTYEIRLILLNDNVDYFSSGYGRRKYVYKDEAEVMAETLRESRQYKEVEVEEAEEAQGLPPGAPRKTFKVDEYDCPTSWMHGSGLASSYFIPVEAECGLWLDFNRNVQGHTHYVAALMSIQGVNPLDGQSLVEIGEKISLKQHKMKCPKHGVDFKQDRYCPECKYKWVPQNYMATTGTPSGLFWLDGFLAPDGKVRQYYFTENESLGVAHQIIGAEKKVYSIGVAFYLSKNPKPVVSAPVVTRGGGSYGSYGTVTCSMPATFGAAKKSAIGGSVLRGSSRLSSQRAEGQKKYLSSNDTLEGILMRDSAESDEGSVKSLDIAAGAMINQKVYEDPNDLDFWQDTPAGLLYINYCSVEQARAILKKGKKDLTNKGEGFLGGLKAGK
jgi:hypothetical protein